MGSDKHDLVDDTQEKAAFEPYNLIQIPTFLGAEFPNEVMEISVLGQVAGYLELFRYCPNVSWYMKILPFQVDIGFDFGWAEYFAKRETGRA